MASKLMFPEIPQLKGVQPLLRTIERKLTNIPDDAESFVENLCLLRDNVSNLFNKHHSLFTQTPLEDRRRLIGIINEMVENMSTMKDEGIPQDDWLKYKEEYGKAIEDEWKTFKEQLENFQWLCTYEFKHWDQLPLKFAQTSVMTLNYINDLEEELRTIMERIDNELKNKSDCIFEKEREILRAPRREVVLTCLGGLKSTKSSFINFLLNKPICPTGNAEATARLTKIQYGDKLSVSLKRHNRAELETHECQNFDEINKKLVELVKFVDDRKEACQDEVIVQLPIEELKGIQLWDVPGFDENDAIDERIKSILQETDIIFALMPLREAFRKTFEYYIRLGIGKNLEKDGNTQTTNSCESVVCFIITCIDQFCIDDQTQLSRDIVLQQLHDKLEETFDMRPSGFSGSNEYRNSNHFVSMCTDVKFSVRDHLECREEFMKKSPKWYQAAMIGVVKLRLDWLQCNIQKILDFYNAEREMERYAKSITKIQKGIKNMNEKILQVLNKELEEMKANIDKSLQVHTTTMAHNLNQYQDITTEDISEMQENITSMVKKEYELYFNEIQAKITQEIAQHISQLVLSTGSTLQNRQQMFHILLNANDIDPYKFKNGRYRTITRTSQGDFSRKMYDAAIGGAGGGAFGGLVTGIVFAAITGGTGVILLPLVVGAGAAFSTSICTIATAATESAKRLHTYVACKLRERQLQKDTNDYSKHVINDSYKIIVQGAHESLQNQMENLRTRLVDGIKERMRCLKHVKQLSQLPKILDSHLPSLKKLFLDILDREFSLLHPDPDELQINENELLGHSHFKVWKGYLSDMIVAVKSIPLHQFNLNEIRYFNVLEHSNIVRYYGIKKMDELNYSIVMEYFDCTLHDFLNSREENRQPFNSQEIDDMLRQINNGLLFIHKNKIVHRDIKPSNILVKYKTDILENTIRYAIADFGLAHVEPRSIVGTPGYIAPEVLNSELGPTTDRSDVYSFGVVIKKVLDYLPKESRNDPLISKWENICKECISKTIHLRPTCQQIEERL